MKKVIIFLLGFVVVYLVISFGWNLLQVQSCTFDYPENPSCEQIAENNSKNCEYIILRWKKVDYNEELQKCKEWEQGQNEQ